MSADALDWTELDSFLARIKYALKRALELWASIRQELEHSGLGTNLIYRGLNADRFHSIAKDGLLMQKSLPRIMKIKGEVTATQMKVIRFESPPYLRILHNQVATMLHNLFAAVDQFHGAFDNPLGERALECLNNGEYYMEMFYEEYELILGFCQILGEITKMRVTA